VQLVSTGIFGKFKIFLENVLNFCTFFGFLQSFSNFFCRFLAASGAKIAK